MLADLIKIHCLAHGVTFPMSRTSRLVVCKEGGAEHTLSDNFPYAGSWVYCCNCQTFIAWDATRTDVSVKECPFCLSTLNPRLYACDHCAVTMVDYDDQTLRKQHTVLSWGMPQPACPGCHKFPRATPRTHQCVVLQATLATARDTCPFCGIDTFKAANNGAKPRAPELDQALAAAQAQAAEAEERIRLAEAAARKEIALRVQAERNAEEIKRRATQELDQLTPLAAESQRARAAAEAAAARAEAETRARHEAEEKARAAEERRLAAEREIRAEAQRRAEAERRAADLAEQVTATPLAPISVSEVNTNPLVDPRAAKRARVSIALYAALAGVLFITLILLIITLLRMTRG